MVGSLVYCVVLIAMALGGKNAAYSSENVAWSDLYVFFFADSPVPPQTPENNLLETRDLIIHSKSEEYHKNETRLGTTWCKTSLLGPAASGQLWDRKTINKTGFRRCAETYTRLWLFFFCSKTCPGRKDNVLFAHNT